MEFKFISEEITISSTYITYGGIHIFYLYSQIYKGYQK